MRCLIVYDGYNQKAGEGGVSHTLTGQRSDADNVPVVLVDIEDDNNVERSDDICPIKG